MNTEHPILLVDDSSDDLLLMRVAFKHAGYKNVPQSVQSGADAIAYLKGEGAFSDRTRYPLPDLVMLDLKMPGTPGFEVLRWIRAEPALKRLCVVVLTASARQEDIRQAFDLGANAYFVKPGDLEDLITLLGGLRECLRFAQFASLTSAS